MSAKKTDKRKRHEVDHERFVREWTIAQSVEDVCQRLALPRHVVNATKKKLIDAGVNLKPMRRNAIDVDKLNAIIDEAKQT